MLLRYAYSVIFCGETVILISGVSKTRSGSILFLNNVVLGLRLGLTLALTLTLKQHLFKTKKIDPDPDPAFY